MSSAPAPTPPRKPNNAVWWILGIVGGGIVILIFFGLLLAGLFVRHLHVDENGKKVEIETPVGAVRVNAGENVHETGLPVYPGAQAAADEGANVDLESPQGAGLAIAAEKYSTADDLDKVSAWYAQKLGPGYRREEHGFRIPHGRVGASSDADVAFVNDDGKRDNGARIVALTRKYGGVEIELVRVGKKEVQ
jgi:hypothetical protein